MRSSDTLTKSRKSSTGKKSSGFRKFKNVKKNNSRGPRKIKDNFVYNSDEELTRNVDYNANSSDENQDQLHESSSGDGDLNGESDDDLNDKDYNDDEEEEQENGGNERTNKEVAFADAMSKILAKSTATETAVSKVTKLIS